MIHILYLIVLAFFQNTAFALVSRARNRDHFAYHAVAACLSNTVFYLTFRELVLGEMGWGLMVPYLIGTVAGSLFGAKLAMRIEKSLGALADPFHHKHPDI